MHPATAVEWHLKGEPWQQHGRKSLRLLLLLSIVSVCCRSGDVAHAQDFPTKPLRIVTSEAGAGADFAARLIAGGLSGTLAQRVIVDNRNGVMVGEIVAKAPPDGYTLLFFGSSLWLSPFMRENLPYDPVKDFAPVSLTTSSPNILVVYPGVAANSVKELIALAKAKPGQLNYGSATVGTASHLAGELFKAMAGVDIVRILYKGSGPAMTDLIGGRLQLMFPTAGSVAPHLKAGRLKALGVTSAQSSELAPGLPTLAASGVPGYESVAMQGMFVPVRTPTVLVARLSQEIVRVLKTPEIRERFFSAGIETVGSSPAEFSAKIRSEMSRMGKVIKDAGIRSE